MYVEDDYESVFNTNVWKGDQRFLFNNAGSRGTRGSNRGIHWLTMFKIAKGIVDNLNQLKRNSKYAQLLSETIEVRQLKPSLFGATSYLARTQMNRAEVALQLMAKKTLKALRKNAGDKPIETYLHERARALKWPQILDTQPSRGDTLLQSLEKISRRRNVLIESKLQRALLYPHIKRRFRRIKCPIGTGKQRRRRRRRRS